MDDKRAEISKRAHAAMKAMAARKRKVIAYRAMVENRKKAALARGVTTRSAAQAARADAEPSTLAWFEGCRASAIATRTALGGAHALEVQVDIGLHVPWEQMPDRQLRAAMERAVAVALHGVDEEPERERVLRIVQQAYDTRGR